MKAYVVTSGSYSDYHINGIYSDREKAELAQKLYAASEIEEWEMDALPEHPPGLFGFYLLMFEDGESRCSPDSAEHVNNPTLRGPIFGKNYAKRTYMLLRVWARDEKHAIKIANEKRAELIALNQWGTPIREKGTLW